MQKPLYKHVAFVHTLQDPLAIRVYVKHIARPHGGRVISAGYYAIAEVVEMDPEGSFPVADGSVASCLLYESPTGTHGGLEIAAKLADLQIDGRAGVAWDAVKRCAFAASLKIADMETSR